MPDRTSPVLFIGNSLAVLVGAHALARRGRPVVVMTEGAPLGGHFAGLVFEGRHFDIGMVLNERPPVAGGAGHVAGYRAEVRNDWTRFSSQVAAWMDAHLELRRVATPTVQVDGRVGPDYLLANRLDLVTGTSGGPQALITRDDARHPVHKALGAAYDTLSYAEAAALSHGQAWHRQYVEPFVRKVFDAGSDDLLARYHRAAWAPLYYPETLEAARRGAPAGLPEYGFHIPVDGSVGAAVKRLADELRAMPAAQVCETGVAQLRRHDGRWEVLSGDTAHAGTDLVLGQSPARCLAMLARGPSAPARAASVMLLFALVRSEAIGRLLGCHMVVDDAFCTYRVCDQDQLAGLDPAWRRVVVEASPAMLAARTGSTDLQAGQDVLVEELCRLMALRSAADVRPLKCLMARHALVLPTREAIASSRAQADMLREAAPGAWLTGSLLGYGVASFNDQVVQGLQIAQELA